MKQGIETVRELLADSRVAMAELPLPERRAIMDSLPQQLPDGTT